MQIDADGILHIVTNEGMDRLEVFTDRLARAIYDHLPRYVRWFVSLEALRAILELAIAGLTRYGAIP